MPLASALLVLYTWVQDRKRKQIPSSCCRNSCISTFSHETIYGGFDRESLLLSSTGNVKGRSGDRPDIRAVLHAIHVISKQTTESHWTCSGIKRAFDVTTVCQKNSVLFCRDSLSSGLGLNLSTTEAYRCKTTKSNVNTDIVYQLEISGRGIRKQTQITMSYKEATKEKQLLQTIDLRLKQTKNIL